jgi:hypothetical protein
MCGSIFVTCIIASDSTHVPVGKLMLTKCYSDICCIICALPKPFPWTNSIVFAYDFVRSFTWMCYQY